MFLNIKICFLFVNERKIFNSGAGRAVCEEEEGIGRGAKIKSLMQKFWQICFTEM